jgi:hypothetical protein
MDSQQILTFYMGKNTPERKDYIMKNLVVPCRWRSEGFEREFTSYFEGRRNNPQKMSPTTP